MNYFNRYNNESLVYVNLDEKNKNTFLQKIYDNTWYFSEIWVTFVN